jgi:hypothetical protein
MDLDNSTLTDHIPESVTDMENSVGRQKLSGGYIKKC